MPLLGSLRWVWFPESQRFFKYGSTRGSSTLEGFELLKAGGPLDTHFLTPEQAVQTQVQSVHTGV